VSPGLGVLILGNSVLEGVGTAFLIPPVYILATLWFTDLTRRAWAFGAISGLGGIGAAAGPLIGGLITTAISWRAAFVFQAAVIVVILLLARGLTDPLPADPTRPFDAVGAVLSGAGMFCLVFGILQAGTNNVLLCRGGREQGAACTADSDCPQGICTLLGRPRRCRVEAFCNVSKQVSCADNRDCPLFPLKDPTDFCPHIVAMKDCQKNEDCGEGGECLNGVTQCEYEAPHVPTGLPGDLVGDWVIGQCTLEDGVWNTATASSLATAVGVEFDRASPQRLYATDFFRVTAFEGDRIEQSNSAATVVIGQATLDFRLDHVGHRLPGDLTVGGFYSQAERTLLRQFDRKARAVSTPDMQALWITDVKRVGRYPRTAASNEAMDLVLGYTDFAETRARPDGQIEHASDVDAQRRCVGGTRIGTPCSKDADCPGSECATTLAIADCGYNRIAVWRRPPKQNGQAIDICIGQPDCVAVERNRGKRPAADRGRADGRPPDTVQLRPSRGRPRHPPGGRSRATSPWCATARAEGQ